MPPGLTKPLELNRVRAVSYESYPLLTCKVFREGVLVKTLKKAPSI
jgi:hypothetical protein